VGLEIGRIDHDGLGFGPLGGQTFHHPAKDAHLAPPLPAVIQCLVCPYSLGASRQRRPLRLTKMIPLGTRRSSTRGLPWLLGNRATGAPFARPSANAGHSKSISSRSLNHIASRQSMGPEPGVFLSSETLGPYEATRHRRPTACREALNHLVRKISCELRFYIRGVMEQSPPIAVLGWQSKKGISCAHWSGTAQTTFAATR